MQNIQFHIAYLLTQHECVIVPVLGAFVVSQKDKEKKSKWGIFSPPENYLTFNPQINHYDLLLANSISKEKNCSVEEAFKLINDYVSNILVSFDEGKKVHIPFVGSLFLKDDEIVLQPDKSLSCNASNFGLTGFSLPNLQDFQKESKINPKKNIKKNASPAVKRKFILLSISIAVAVIAVFLIAMLWKNGHIESVYKQITNIVQPPEQKAVIEKPIIETTEVSAHIIPEPADTIIISKEKPAFQTVVANQKDIVKSNIPYYYIIIASLPDQTSAKKTVAEIKSAGFKDAAILFSDGKYRIYTNRFDKKLDAEKFLFQFRKDHPKYKNAWLLRRTGL